MACPICGAKCVCRKRGEDGRCCSCHKHKTRTPAQAAAHQQYDRARAEVAAGNAVGELLTELGRPQRVEIRHGFSYPGLFDRPVVTDLLIINDGPVRVVVATERADNPGASITNTIERLAKELMSETGWFKDDFILVEHYPPRGGDHPRSIDHLPRSLDRVDFERMWSGVSWKHLGINGLKALIAPVAVPA